jgi:hypothetical protein
MESKEALVQLLSLLLRSVQNINSHGKALNTDRKKTDMEETAAMLKVTSPSFSSIAQALDDLFSLNTAAADFNESISEMINDLEANYEKIQSEIVALQPALTDSLSSETVDSSAVTSMKTPSEAQLAKYKFSTIGLEEHLASIKVFPYYQPPPAVLSKRMRRKDYDNDIVTNLDRCMTSGEQDTIFSFQTLEEISASIVKLRKENDLKEEHLNAEYHYESTSHVVDTPNAMIGTDEDSSARNINKELLTLKLINEIEQLESDCARMDEDLSRIMHQQQYS